MGSPILPYTNDQGLAGARLCEFKTGSADLLKSHKDWMWKYFFPSIRQYPLAEIQLAGNTSMLGDASKNMALSKRRVDTVEEFIKMNCITPVKKNWQGSRDAAAFKVAPENNDGYYRAVLMTWSGVPHKIETPRYPPPEEAAPIKHKKLHAPKGCWCVVGVDSFGIPLKPGFSVGTTEVTLLNDEGERWLLKGVGAGAGLGVDVDAPKGLNWLLQLLLKSGDAANASQTIKDLNIIGPNETSGGVFRRFTWKADLDIWDITRPGLFTIVNGGFHLLIGGGEIGFIFFGLPPEIPLVGQLSALMNTWAFYGQAGLGTWKAAAEISETVYKLTDYYCLK
jgi:hypothetical protein